jgi:iron(III) transport system permease protein
MHKKKPEIRLVFFAILLFFVLFLAAPLGMLLLKSFASMQGFDLSNYIAVFQDQSVAKAIGNSVKASALAAIISTVLAFVLAYTLHFSRTGRLVKRLIGSGIVVPMLLPSITYGFAIIYSFGKQGLLTKLFGVELLKIYGFQGLLIGYVIYTLPFAFFLLNNSFSYIDKKFLIVSELMGDSFWRGFVNTALRPLIGTIGGAFVVSFILSFTDFGIPASIGGNYNVIATELYQAMLGSIPDFNQGSVIAMLMLLPAVAGAFFLHCLERFNFAYDSISQAELPENKMRDLVCGVASTLIVTATLSVFVVMFFAPFVKNYPYDLRFSLEFVQNALFTGAMLDVYENSILVAGASALGGTLLAYSAALVNVRTAMPKRERLLLDMAALVANTAPGMVLGLAYLMLFNDSDLKGTFLILIISNIVHFFTTPYLMAKNCLGKLNPAWETTGELMGDTWAKTVRRVIVPNSAATIIEMFGYFFINCMVTISAVIFLVTARTALVTSKIKELQHFASFNEIFVLSILIFVTNLLMRFGCEFAARQLSSGTDR